jgi:hypothetical protein
MDGLRWLFPAFIRLSERFETDSNLRSRCRDLLAKLPEPPLGVWRPDGTIDATIDAYAPAAGPGEPREHRNFENPALYRVFPFGLSGIGTDDYDRAVHTFEHRIFSGSQGWSLDSVWAARLGLRAQACALLAEHTRKWNRFRYGGWDSGNSAVFPDGLAVVPYTDAPGVACYALHKILLQSHNGMIRILPAVAPGWSGMFRLRAEGGFLVAAAFEGGNPRFVEIVSLRGNPCRLANPWEGRITIQHATGDEKQAEGGMLEFETDVGETCLLFPEATPLAEYTPVESVDAPAGGPGLPGRDF